MRILGISGALGHDPSAALMVDGQLVAATEEERFNRIKHAKDCFPEQAIRFCLDEGGLSPADIDAVAYPFAPVSLTFPGRWHFAKRYWYAPDQAIKAIFNGNRHYRRNHRNALKGLTALGFPIDRLRFVPVEHHLAHASSAYHLSGFKEKTAIVSIDGKGEFATMFFGYGEHGKIHKLKEFYDPESLGGMYGAFTEYLGFRMLDGEYKVMGMAPYGDPTKVDLSRLARWGNGEFEVNTRYLNVIGARRYKKNGKGHYFSRKLVDELGPMPETDQVSSPYIDYAAALQDICERASLHLIEHHLGDLIQETGYLAFAGGVALNVKLNQLLLEMDGLKELFVQPAAGDSGTSVGAASYVAQTMGDAVQKMSHAYLGPSYSSETCHEAAERRAHEGHVVRRLQDPAAAGAQILALGHPLSWFQGRMEFGPRALGCRSILGDPSHRGVADRINAQIKFREKWRPFCPSMLEEAAEEVLGTRHPAPYMTFAFVVREEWHERIPEVVHVDGTARVQLVNRETNPAYHRLIEAFQRLRGVPVVLNTSMNRGGEPLVCSPDDALTMFHGCDLNFLIMEDTLIVKTAWAEQVDAILEGRGVPMKPGQTSTPSVASAAGPSKSGDPAP